MASRIENQHETKLNGLKWFLVAVLIVAGLAANYYYNQLQWPLRLLAWLFLLAVSAAVVFQTTQGKQLVEFARESRMELRKVVWPTRQETIQITLLIAGVVVLLALILWGVDGILLRVVGWLTGQRG
ncbi:MAG: preprotein translocase subunit SecE [Pseudomonadota bacterium]